MATKRKMAVFWYVTPCSLVEVYRRFRGACCLHIKAVMEDKKHLTKLHGADIKKTEIFTYEWVVLLLWDAVTPTNTHCMFGPTET
jgi:hypothetical protein